MAKSCFLTVQTVKFSNAVCQNLYAKPMRNSHCPFCSVSFLQIVWLNDSLKGCLGLERETVNLADFLHIPWPRLSLSVWTWKGQVSTDKDAAPGLHPVSPAICCCLSGPSGEVHVLWGFAAIQPPYWVFLSETKWENESGDTLLFAITPNPLFFPN